MNSLAEMDQDVKKMFETLLPYAAAKLNVDTKDFRRRIAKVIMAMSPEVNGSTYSQDKGETFTIELNIGMMIFIHKIVKIFVSVFPQVSERGEIVDTTPVPWNVTLRGAHNVIKAFYVGNLMASESIPFTRLTQGQQRVAPLLLDCAERFVIAHELGHVIARLNSPTAPTLWNDYCREIIRENKWRFAEEDEVVRKWGQEIRADVEGAFLTLQVMPEDMLRVISDNPSGVGDTSELQHMFQVFAYLGMTLFFVSGSLLEGYCLHSTGKESLSNTHPPASMRFAVIQSLFEDHFPPFVKAASNGFFETHDKVLQGLAKIYP